MKKKNKMEKPHSFFPSEAKKYGINKAILLFNIRFWLDKNKANDTNANDGYYWTYNSSTALAKLFPYMKAGSIKNWLKELENDGVLKSGNYNKVNYDRTKWYTIPSEYAIALTVPSIAPEMQSTALTVPPIPDVNSDVNSYKQKAIDEFEEVWSLFRRKESKADARTYFISKAREGERKLIKAALIAYNEKYDKKYGSDMGFLLGGNSFFKKERWREHIPTKEEIEAVKIPKTKWDELIPSEKLNELWDMALKQPNAQKAFDAYCFSFNSGGL